MKNVIVLSIAISIFFVGCEEAPKPDIPKVVIKPKKVVIKPKLVEPKISKISKSVNVTGAAGELKRLTFGGFEELVSEVSRDGKWLLMDTYSTDKSTGNRIIQKLNIFTGQKMILTPSNSSNDRAIWAKNDKTIIYTSTRSGTTIVESMGVNGESGIRFITNASLGKSYSANINSQKDDIVFALNGSISLVKPDGTQIRMFGSGHDPKFSPNGKKILFIRYDGNYHHIFSMKKNGTSLIQYTTETYNDFEAVWSPDGKRIAFISDRSNQHKHLYVMDINGRNLLQLTDGNYDVGSLDWANDGYIYFSANAGGNRDIWRLRIK